MGYYKKRSGDGKDGRYLPKPANVLLRRRRLSKQLTVVVIIASLALLCQFTNANAVAGKKQITVILRLDDYSNATGNLEDQLIEIFGTYQIPCTLGVVPYQCTTRRPNASSTFDTPLSQRKIDFLNKVAKNGNVEITLHGYCHEIAGKCPSGGPTEFYGINYQNQYTKIKKGKELLEFALHTNISTFVPPFETYDANTLRAVSTLKFKTISADRLRIPKDSLSLQYLPKTCDLWELKKAVESARNIPDEEPVIVVLFHPYDFLEIDKKHGRLHFQDLTDILTWLKKQSDVHLRTISQTTEMYGGFDASRYRLYKIYSALYYAMPWSKFGHATAANNVYLSIKTMRNQIITFTIFVLIVLLASAILANWIGKTLCARSKTIFAVMKYAMPFFLIAVFVYVLRDSRLGAEGLVMITILLGALIGVWASSPKFKK